MDRRELAIIWTSHPISGRSEAATVRIPPLPPPPPVCGHLLHLSLVLVPNCGFLRRSRVHPASIPSAHRPAGHCLLRLSCDGLCHGLSQQRHDSARHLFAGPPTLLGHHEANADNNSRFLTGTLVALTDELYRESYLPVKVPPLQGCVNNARPRLPLLPG